MPSPFPGMDPYLEGPAFWSDFHATFINYWREAVSAALPPQYDARIDERFGLITAPGEPGPWFKPDVAITQLSHVPETHAAAVAAATLQPVVVPLYIEEEDRETYIKILHRPQDKLVAVLELLSPSNKEQPDRTAYLVRRNGLLHRDVHVVDLDLLHHGQRIPLGAAYPAGDYFALVADATRRPDCEVYPWTTRQPLPAIDIPLRPPDPPIRIRLGEVFAVAYDRGRYGRVIDYSKPPPIALPAEDLGWIRERIEASATT